ncbi:hypothetical protein OC834_003574 [Tilletia horrida]|nr:hypothetical protein OC834_003574 [Tilletia horrida]
MRQPKYVEDEAEEAASSESSSSSLTPIPSEVTDGDTVHNSDSATSASSSSSELSSEPSSADGRVVFVADDESIVFAEDDSVEDEETARFTKGSIDASDTSEQSAWAEQHIPYPAQLRRSLRLQEQQAAKARERDRREQIKRDILAAAYDEYDDGQRQSRRSQINGRSPREQVELKDGRKRRHPRHPSARQRTTPVQKASASSKGKQRARTPPRRKHPIEVEYELEWMDGRYKKVRVYEIRLSRLDVHDAGSFTNTPLSVLNSARTETVTSSSFMASVGYLSE